MRPGLESQARNLLSCSRNHCWPLGRSRCRSRGRKRSNGAWQRVRESGPASCGADLASLDGSRDRRNRSCHRSHRHCHQRCRKDRRSKPERSLRKPELALQRIAERKPCRYKELARKLGGKLARTSFLELDGRPCRALGKSVFGTPNESCKLELPSCRSRIPSASHSIALLACGFRTPNECSSR